MNEHHQPRKQSTVPYCEFTSQIHRPWPSHSISYASLRWTCFTQLLSTIISFICHKVPCHSMPRKAGLNNGSLCFYSENLLLILHGSPATLPGAGRGDVDIQIFARLPSVFSPNCNVSKTSSSLLACFLGCLIDIIRPSFHLHTLRL